jgi:hypothetical protein
MKLEMENKSIRKNIESIQNDVNFIFCRNPEITSPMKMSQNSIL